jgi:transcriptional regulator with XRE-family HTH domain
VRTDRLIKLRKERNITQADLAKQLGIERTTYGKYETSGIQPPLEIIIKLAGYYDVSTDYILGNDRKLDFSTNALGNAVINGVNGQNTGSVTVTVTNGESHSRELSKEEQEILRIYSVLDAKSRHKMFDGILSIEEEFLGGMNNET